MNSFVNIDGPVTFGDVFLHVGYRRLMARSPTFATIKPMTAAMTDIIQMKAR